ncbi:MAG: radical SAM family heme chaperone HemW [Planctomycetaceae bacterium]|nr:radical SAM family heme chaperone HemW [Planctomycetaceae bacterium]
MQTPFSTPRAAYVHVPFCAHRCGYCDFTVIAGRDDLAGDYLHALELELAALGHPREVDTLFVGGGTPTQLALPELERLLALLQRWLPLSAAGEFSIEANPARFERATADTLRTHGVNRVSLGVQSFSAPLLRTLERDHDAETVARAVDALRGRIDNFGFDLIYGVPEQSLDGWQASLQQAVNLQPAHISTYGLTYEKGTAFWTRRQQQTLTPVDDASEAAMYSTAMDWLPAHGFDQYELSNFARPGRESRHNAVYWQGLPYYGFGPGAAAYVDGTRRTNHRSVTTWLKRVLSGESGVGASETLSTEERAREALWLGLRRTCGVDRSVFAERFEVALDSLAGESLPALIAAGWIADDGRSIRLTRPGRLLADKVAAEFL